MSLAKFNTLDVQFEQTCQRLGRVNAQLQAKGPAGHAEECGELLQQVTALINHATMIVQQMTDECKNHDAFQRKMLSDKVMAHRNMLRHHSQLHNAKIRNQRLKVIPYIFKLITGTRSQQMNGDVLLLFTRPWHLINLINPNQSYPNHFHH